MASTCANPFQFGSFVPKTSVSRSGWVQANAIIGAPFAILDKSKGLDWGGSGVCGISKGFRLCILTAKLLAKSSLKRIKSQILSVFVRDLRMFSLTLSWMQRILYRSSCGQAEAERETSDRGCCQRSTRRLSLVPEAAHPMPKLPHDVRWNTRGRG